MKLGPKHQPHQWISILFVRLKAGVFLRRAADVRTKTLCFLPQEVGPPPPVIAVTETRCLKCLKISLNLNLCFCSKYTANSYPVNIADISH